jgi:AraC family transcriptional regulator
LDGRSVPVTDRKSKKQLLEELIQAHKALEKRVETQDQMLKRFQSIASQENLFVGIIDYFPYPIAVFSDDGTLEMVNNSFLGTTGIRDAETIVNKYNVLNTCSTDYTEIRQAIKRTFSGETIFLFDMDHLLEDLREEYGDSSKVIPSYYDIVLFPIKNNGDQVYHAVAVFIMHNNEYSI